MTDIQAPLEALLNPSSVAVIGASSSVDKSGGRRWRSLLTGGFAGRAYPVHPTAETILGQRAYPSLSSINDTIDLAVVIVPPASVPGVLAECADNRVRSVVVISGGFGETGAEGKKVELEMVRLLRAAGTRMVGPNCAGVYSASASLNVLGWGVPRGSIALISQSGNMALGFLQRARESSLGFSKLITVGNAADVSIPEYVDYLLQDLDTKAILLYVEGFRLGEGRELCELLRRTGPAKPVVIFKPGRTAIGRAAAVSHTASLAGEHRVFSEGMRWAGAIEVSDSEDAWAACVALSQQPPPSSGAFVVVSDGGGHATVVTDAMGMIGLDLAEFGHVTRVSLECLLPARAAIGNPVDFAGAAESDPVVIPQVIEKCLEDPAVGGVILAGHFGGYYKASSDTPAPIETQVADQIASVAERVGKPLLVHSIYAGEPLPAFERLRAGSIPVMGSLEMTARAAGALSMWSGVTRRNTDRAPRISSVDLVQARHLLGRAIAGQQHLLEPDARRLVALYGLDASSFLLVDSEEQAEVAADALACPAALKLVAESVLHKTEIGGVILDVRGGAAARSAFRALRDIADRQAAGRMSVLVSPMIRDGIEMVFGGVRDPQFGAVVMAGLGGILVEVLDDVAFGLAPLSSRDAHEMLDQLKGKALFSGIRGRAAVDMDRAADLLVRLSELMNDLPEVREIDLNPVFVNSRGAVVADARVIVN